MTGEESVNVTTGQAVKALCAASPTFPVPMCVCRQANAFSLSLSSLVVFGSSSSY